MVSPTSPLISLLLLGIFGSFACARPIDRPLEGAQPARASEVSSSRLLAEPPPTVSAPVATATGVPSPIVIVLSPVPSPAVVARDPILSGLLPAPNALVPPGPVNIAARISATADLADVVLTVNGTPVQALITAQSPRVWLVGYTGRLDAGKHEIRLNATDRDGRSGGYRWQFDVQGRPATQPSPSPARISPASRP